MARKFSELRDKMSPQAQDKLSKLTQAMLDEMPLPVSRRTGGLECDEHTGQTRVLLSENRVQASHLTDEE